VSHEDATQALFVHLYEDLRRLAKTYMGRERSSHTLAPTALVHEAYLCLSAQRKQNWDGAAEFYAAASTMMRRILINYAKRANSQKRGEGGEG